MTNLGIAIGTPVAAIGVQLDSIPAGSALIGPNALTFLAAALVLPEIAGGSGSGAARPVRRSPLAVLRDHRYVLLTAVCSMQSLFYDVLSFAVPLWIVRRTAAPHWLVGVVLLVNTSLVVLLQVRASRDIDRPGRAALALRRAGGVLLVGCVLIVLAGYVPGPVAVVLLVAFAVLFTGAELWYSTFAVMRRLEPRLAGPPGFLGSWLVGAM